MEDHVPLAERRCRALGESLGHQPHIALPLTESQYIIGGALVGASVNCSSYSYYDDYVYSCVNTGMWQGGVALMALASITFLAWLVVLILRFTSWYRQPGAGGNVSYQTNGNAQHPVDAAPAMHQQASAPKPETSVGMTELAPRYCPTCKNSVSSSFCGNCGTQVE